MKRRTPIPYVMLLATLVAAGCYTVLRHPHPADLSDESGMQKACSDCHTDADLYHFPDAYDADWYRFYPAPWAVYYEPPWWYEDYWNYAPHPVDPDNPADAGNRQLWSRGGGASGTLPYQGRQKEVGTDGNPTPQEEGKSQNPPEGDKDKAKKEKTKRRLWGR